jgi:hypothetical protein
MHQNAMPTENMSAKSHLRSCKFLIQANTAIKLLFGSENYELNFFPFSPFIKIGTSYFFMSSMRGINYAT